MMTTTTTPRPITAYEEWLLEQSWSAPYPTTGITFTDFFCGFGGSSIGLTEAGLQLVWAANHWKLAIENHAANFGSADHYQGDISGYDMRRVPKADVAWLSPECTWHSPAGGRKRVRAELDALFPDEHVASEAGERSRATMWDVVRAAEAKAFKIVIVENVVEVTTWPLFDAWLHAMETLGYNHQIVCVTAAHIGDETNPHAPQWRDRIYFVFYKKSIPFPVIEPRPLAWCAQCEGVVESRQSWKREDRRRIGKFGPQYFYVCASGNHPSSMVEPFVLPAAAAIDWSDLGTRIGDRPLREFFADKARTQSLGWHHLAPATLRRVGVGYRMFGRPVVAAHTGQTWDAAKSGRGDYVRVQSADGAPLSARQAGGSGDAVAVPPFITNMRHGAEDHGRQYLPDEQPLPTSQTKIGEGLVVPPLIVAGYDYKGGDARRVKTTHGSPLGSVVANGRGHHQLVTPPFVVEQRGTSTARGADEPLGAITAGGNHHALTVPAGAFLAEYYGTGTAKSATEPIGTVSSRSHHGLTIPDGAFLSRAYGSRGGDGSHLNTSVFEPTHPITASGGGNHALVIPPTRGAPRPKLLDIPDADLQESILNSLFRPLGPLEHGRAQRFPDSYAVTGNSGDRTKGFGNAVASNVAHWLGTFCVAALAGHVAMSERSIS